MEAGKEFKKDRLIFVHQLRGLATLMVLVWHLTIMFWYSNESIASIFSLKPAGVGKMALPFLYRNIIDALMAVGIDFGMFGVALFFLISGFVIFRSVDKGGGI